MAPASGNEPINPSGGFWRELVRLPFRKFVIETSLSEAEVAERLRGIVEPGSPFLAPFWRSNRLFRGEVSPQGFKVMRIILYRNSFLPVVSGTFEPGPSGARVAVTMRPMRPMQVFLALWFGLGLAFIAVALGRSIGPAFSSGHSGTNPHAGSPILLIGSVAGVSAAYLIFAGSFGYEARKARALLEDALQAMPSDRIQQILAGTKPEGAPRALMHAVIVALIGAAAAVIAMVLVQHGRP